MDSNTMHQIADDIFDSISGDLQGATGDQYNTVYPTILSALHDLVDRINSDQS